MNETETKREKIEMAVLSRLQRERRQRQAVHVLKPLIDRAKVPASLKKATLAKAPNGVERTEILALGDAIDVEAVIAKLTANNMIRLNASKKFEAAMDVPPELSQKEEAKFAAKLLSDWPEAERERIVSVFAGEGEDEEDDE